MFYQTKGFSQSSPDVLHIDLNSCFAAIEQQANPMLRGRPVAVAAYDSPGGCILASSVEAKKIGIKVGMRVKDAKIICSELLVLKPDPDKYRYVHKRLYKILSFYTDRLFPKSIDEFVLHLAGYPALKRGRIELGREIKQKIKREIGEWLTVSIGFGPNRFLAKTASNLNKPDGLDIIDKSNFFQIYKKLSLSDLCGIAGQNTLRLNRVAIYTVTDFYLASARQLKAAFESILAYFWYFRLRGLEVDDISLKRKSYGHSFALPKPLRDRKELLPILAKLSHKTGQRMRQAGFKAGGICLAVVYRDFIHWHQSRQLKKTIFSSRDIFVEAIKLLAFCPWQKPVREIAVSCFSLEKNNNTQLSFWQDIYKKAELTEAVDKLNRCWGDFTVYPGRMLGTSELVHDRISFGGVRDTYSTS